MTRLQEVALASVCALAGALLAALLFAVCEPDPGPYVHVPVPTVEYDR